MNSSYSFIPIRVGHPIDGSKPKRAQLAHSAAELSFVVHPHHVHDVPLEPRGHQLEDRLSRRVQTTVRGDGPHPLIGRRDPRAPVGSYFLGRAKIDRITWRIIRDRQVMLTNVLTDTVHLTLRDALNVDGEGVLNATGGPLGLGLLPGWRRGWRSATPGSNRDGHRGDRPPCSNDRGEATRIHTPSNSSRTGRAPATASTPRCQDNF